MSDRPTALGGTCSARFDPLRELFAARLQSGEDLGASLAVNIDGEIVVDLWGGWADEARIGLKGSPTQVQKTFSPKFEKKVEKLSGDLKLGGRLTGRITGGKMSDGLKYSWEADFDMTLPKKSAEGGLVCGT